MNRKHLLLASALIVFSIAAHAQNNSAATQNPFHWTGAVAAGKTLAIKNVSGDVSVDSASGGQVEITATKHGDQADRIRIQVVPSNDGVTVCAIFPSGDGGDASTCEPGEHWNVHQRDGNDARVDFVVHIPRDVRLTVRDVNGSVKATGLGEFADVTSVNGSVSVETDSWAQLKTVNGSVNGKFGRADWTEPLRISTVNGDINLRVPADLSAEFDFHTVNGDFDSDLPVTIRGRETGHGPKNITGTIGNGGRGLSLHTVNGSASIRRG